MCLKWDVVLGFTLEVPQKHHNNVSNGGLIREKYVWFIGQKWPPNVNSNYDRKNIQNSDVKSSPKLQLGTMKPLATKYEAETYWSSSIGL